MKWLWCWRCKTEMPMLDDAEFTEVTARQPNTPLKNHLANVLNEYQRITGYKETNPNAVHHHKLSLYGPPCKKCNRPLRSPNANLCGACMTPVEHRV